jgi:hypothetical protein
MESTANGTVRKYVNRAEVSEASSLPATALDTSAIPSQSRSRPSWRSKPSLRPVSSTSTS